MADKIKKVRFKDVCPQYIHGGSQGWEIPLEDSKIPAGYFRDMGMTPADKADIRNYLKGLKLLFNRACEKRFFDDVMGNYKNVQQKWKAILKSLTHEDIVKIGDCHEYELTFYITGEVGAYIK